MNDRSVDEDVQIVEARINRGKLWGYGWRRWSRWRRQQTRAYRFPLSFSRYSPSLFLFLYICIPFSFRFSSSILFYFSWYFCVLLAWFSTTSNLGTLSLCYTGCSSAQCLEGTRRVFCFLWAAPRADPAKRGSPMRLPVNICISRVDNIPLQQRHIESKYTSCSCKIWRILFTFYCIPFLVPYNATIETISFFFLF